jgi:hypothetical protein
MRCPRVHTPWQAYPACKNDGPHTGRSAPSMHSGLRRFILERPMGTPQIQKVKCS